MSPVESVTWRIMCTVSRLPSLMMVPYAVAISTAVGEDEPRVFVKVSSKPGVSSEYPKRIATSRVISGPTSEFNLTKGVFKEFAKAFTRDTWP